MKKKCICGNNGEKCQNFGGIWGCHGDCHVCFDVQDDTPTPPVNESMTTTDQVIEQEIKEFQNMRELSGIRTIWIKHPAGVGIDIDEWIRSFASTLIERVGSELIGEDERAFCNIKGITITDNSRMFRNGLRAEMRTKLQEMKGKV